MSGLSPDDEAKFQSWITSLPWHAEYLKQYGERPDLNTPDYNYRKAWQLGLQPQRYAPDGNRFHWPSVGNGVELKAANHPTAWMQDFMTITGRDPHTPGVLSAPQVKQLEGVLMRRYGK